MGHSRRLAVTGLIAFTVLAGLMSEVAAQSQPASSESAVPHIDYDAIKARYVHAKWTYATAEEAAQAYPRQAQDSRVQGATQIACFIQPDGHLNRCVVLAESPAGYGFGKTTSDLFVKFVHVEPASVEGGIQSGDFFVFIYKWQLG